ncbi:tyrosine phosphatase family-domain-containing protein [Kickxella alabastrina]|uniref:tyrosine phosphatase family-domain-containing protein n=1 Tax=Kickxella alabastrina TaxID=61397 RepID=UPI00221E73B8|nr:tyrosine phosphatase family-domain-containing protein [Kickxella alabastrina]KAI7831030.1 tyrosine phosphatase family-domain-containing protein [Kickxella alabastrina]
MSELPSIQQTVVSALVSHDESLHDAEPAANFPITITNTIVATKPFEDGANMDECPEDLYPPENFAMVCPYIYRSGMPKKRHFPFLQKLKLKSILTLILEEYPEQSQKFLNQNGIKLFQFGVAGNKEPFADIPEAVMCEALAVLMDRRNHPILIHCNKGKHRTGCLVGCLRKVQEWSHTSIFDEYRRYSAPKSRSMDQQFIELFDVRPVLEKIDLACLPDWPMVSARVSFSQ